MTDVTNSPPHSAAMPSGVALPQSLSITTIVADEPVIHKITVLPFDQSRGFSIPSRAHSLEGFRDWAESDSFPDRGRIAFAAGEIIIDMSPELFETHNFIKVEVGFVLYGLIRPKRLGLFFGDRALFTNEKAEISTEPDAIYVSNTSIQAGRCKLMQSTRSGINKELVGSPDWILEIVSPTSIKKDKEILREAYFRAGVSEYWLIDAIGDEIEFQILIPNSDGFISVRPTNGWLSSPTFGCSFRLTREKGEDGFRQYTLHTQENS